MYAFLGLGGQELVFMLFIVGLPVLALIDVVRSEFRGTNDKLIWVIIIVFFNIIGTLLYFFIGRNQRIS
ncbi:PLDc N-terminal domain-containing protein [Spirosoma panaciterrae]|uniref:PLDc N-terminal domain-containing protein n=1 Tax=Spirosoma panaciterrae TaxID=496058 RepID=UPI00036B282C|nr:PLDc N-terminal domain-containing protein [Spirosoma panaciterrae]